MKRRLERHARASLAGWVSERRTQAKKASARRKAPVTEFQRQVYRLVSMIPSGRVVTYQELARAMGCGSPRAIGQALRANPWAPRVPCHRVIASDLSPGGYRGDMSGPALRLKLRRLAREGVRFRNGRLVDPNRLFHFRSVPAWDDE